MQEFKLDEYTPYDAYKLLRSVVTPRPIALVTTVDGEGRINAAPYSFFNAIAFDPCMVVLGVDARPDGSQKDTGRNIRETREFVVNLVDEALGERMNLCSAPLPPGESEPAWADLEMVPSQLVKPPRLAASPVCLECRRHTTLEVGNKREIILGEVFNISIRDDIVDREKLHIDSSRLALIARLGGFQYATTRDVFEMPAPKWPAANDDEG